MKIVSFINTPPQYYYSKYRTELMGLAMLGVLCMHLGIWTGTKSILSIPAFFGYTDTFFILSGFGIYHSLAKSSSTKFGDYFGKRCKRVFLPYVCIALPMFIVISIAKDYSIGFVLANITTLNLWYEGNPYGMWYIGVTLVIYLIYPFLHRVMYGQKSSPHYFVFIVMCSMAIPVAIYYFANDYYEMINVIWIAMPSFLMGSALGYCHFNNVSYNTFMYLFLMASGWIICKYIGQYIPPFSAYGVVFQKMVLLPILTSALMFLEHSKVFNGVFAFLGRYSLEIYVFHLLLYSVLQSVLPCATSITGVSAILISLLLCKPIHSLGVIINR